MRVRTFVVASTAFAAGLAFAQAALAEIRIGLATAVTGPVAAIGQQSKLGTEAGVAAINAKGGVLGQKLVLEVVDDACEPKQAVSVANQLMTRNVKLVLGHLCSGAAIAAADVYTEERGLMMTASATNPMLTENRPGGVIFRACGRDDQQGATAGRVLADRFRDSRIAFVHDKQPYGAGLVQEALKTYNAAGGKEVYSGSINPGEKDFSALITRLAQAKADVLYFGGYHPELGLIVRQARDQGLKMRFMGGEGLATTEFWAITGDAGAGTLFTYAPDVKTRPAAAEALAQIRKREPTADPGNFAFYYYAAVQVLAQAIEKAGKADPQAVVKVLREANFDTIVGSMAFDSKGDLKAPEYVIYEWRDGKFAPAASL